MINFNDPELADPKNGGIIMSAVESAFHGEGNIKSISENGKHELVKDPSRKIKLDEITDPEHMGTYNYFHPKGNLFEKAGHVLVDVGPWVVFGNSPNDLSTIYSRSKDSLVSGLAYVKKKMENRRVRSR